VRGCTNRAGLRGKESGEGRRRALGGPDWPNEEGDSGFFLFFFYSEFSNLFFFYFLFWIQIQTYPKFKFKYCKHAHQKRTI
jgi:hypothetical protein